MPARVEAIHLSTASRAPLRRVDQVRALPGRGLEGDRHGRRGGGRAVLLVEAEVLELVGLVPGDVREQVTVRGLDLARLPVGARLRVGGAVLAVAEPCDPCERMEELRAGLMQALDGRRGRFASIVQEGRFAVGDELTVEPPA